MTDSDQKFWHFFVNCMLIRMGKRTYCACSANDSRYCWGETLSLTPPVQTENKCALFQCCGTRMLRAIRRHSTGDQEVIELFWNVQTYEWTLYENGRWRHQSINPYEPWEDPVNSDVTQGAYREDIGCVDALLPFIFLLSATYAKMSKGALQQ